MNQNSKKLFNLFLLSVLLITSSCAVGVFTFYKSEYESNHIPSIIDPFTKGKKIIHWTENKRTYQSFTLQEVIERLGNPDKRWQENGDDYLLYYSGELRFSGIVPTIFIIPIPLVMPAGTKHEILIFKNGLFHKTIRVGTQEHITGCGMGAQKMEWECYLWKKI